MEVLLGSDAACLLLDEQGHPETILPLLVATVLLVPDHHGFSFQPGTGITSNSTVTGNSGRCKKYV